jgi:hypothetical protein
VERLDKGTIKLQVLESRVARPSEAATAKKEAGKLLNVKNAAVISAATLSSFIHVTEVTKQIGISEQ